MMFLVYINSISDFNLKENITGFAKDLAIAYGSSYKLDLVFDINHRTLSIRRTVRDSIQLATPVLNKFCCTSTSTLTSVYLCYFYSHILYGHFCYREYFYNAFHSILVLQKAPIRKISVVDIVTHS